jgi:hypothetical protein
VRSFSISPITLGLPSTDIVANWKGGNSHNTQQHTSSTFVVCEQPVVLPHDENSGDFIELGHKYTQILAGEVNKSSLFLGSIDYLMADDLLDDLHINSIVAVLPYEPALLSEVLCRHPITREDFFLYPLEDSPAEYISLFDSPGIYAVTDFIHNQRLQGRTVLVHCDAGITRSPTVIIAYIMRFGYDLANPKRVSFRAATTMVRSMRLSLDIVLFSEELKQLEEHPQCPSSLMPTFKNNPRSPTTETTETSGSAEEEATNVAIVPTLQLSTTSLRSMSFHQRTKQKRLNHLASSSSSSSPTTPQSDLHTHTRTPPPPHHNSDM